MGNIISSAGHDLTMSNGETSVLIELLSVAASSLARTPWQKDLAVWFAMHDQSVFGGGCVGFDLDELGWSPEQLMEEQRFVLACIDAAMSRTLWDKLDYAPDEASLSANLQTFRAMVAAAKPQSGQRDWCWQGSQPLDHELCKACGVYLHIEGCVVCNNAATVSTTRGTSGEI